MNINNANGFVKIYRSLIDWQWYTDHNTLVIFLHLLLKANHKNGWHKGAQVKRGQLLTGYGKLSEETGLSVREIRTAINHLISTNEVTREASPKGSVITIVNYSSYQATGRASDKRATNKRQASDKRATTNKNPKNPKNEKKKTVGGADISPAELKGKNPDDMTEEEKVALRAWLLSGG